MLFGLYNTPATFQAYINKIIQGILNKYCVVYLNNILIYSQIKEEHEQHVNKVLSRLSRANLYTKLSKYSFHQKEVHFLGFIIRQDRIYIDPERIRTISNWLLLTSFYNVQVFLGFIGYFW
jgi:hypothetical protein